MALRKTDLLEPQPLTPTCKYLPTRHRRGCGPKLFRSLAAPLALAVALLTAAPAQASAVYTYTGNNFANFVSAGPTTPPDQYTTTDRVTVVMELARR